MMGSADTIDVLIARDRGAYRLYTAPGSWKVPPIFDRMDERGDVYPVMKPDLEDLHNFMWNCDAPYEVRPIADGGAEIRATRRSALILWHWLEELMAPAPLRRGGHRE